MSVINGFITKLGYGWLVSQNKLSYVLKYSIYFARIVNHEEYSVKLDDALVSRYILSI